MISKCQSLETWRQEPKKLSANHSRHESGDSSLEPDLDFNDRPALFLIYDHNEQVKQLADQIHEGRKLKPPACADCIRAAIRQLGLTLEDLDKQARGEETHHTPANPWFGINTPMKPSQTMDGPFDAYASSSDQGRYGRLLTAKGLKTTKT